MDKFSFISLWDVYSGLLTAVQQEITDLYFNKDLTVSEIAEEKGVSRQAVSDCLKGCKKQLEEYEEKLHFRKRLTEISLNLSFLQTDAAKWAEGFKASHPECAAQADALSAILSNDYSKEVAEALKEPQTDAIFNKDYTERVYGSKKTGEE